MADLVSRSERNPILRPQDVKPSQEWLVVESVLNPGAFRFAGKTYLLLRVAERPRQKDDMLSTVILDPSAEKGLRIVEVRKDDPALQHPHDLVYKGQHYLPTLSHLRLASSDDGVTFHVEDTPTLIGQGTLESFGIEDCRVTEIKGTFYLTYSAASPYGVGVGLISTTDWQHFTRHGMMFVPNNKDCALFPEKIADSYFVLHRPSAQHIWIGSSPDLLHWGDHRCIVVTRPGKWDSKRVGAGDSPIRTSQGWLEIYHGVDEQNRYCLGALLFDLKDPTHVLARSAEPIMEPVMPYEKTGFIGNVVFTNGNLVAGDTLTIYYGAADEVVCAGICSIGKIFDTLR
jgi:predicted GH43/DUF377 family glycosyl hydrolase